MSGVAPPVEAIGAVPVTRLTPDVPPPPPPPEPLVALVILPFASTVIFAFVNEPGVIIVSKFELSITPAFIVHVPPPPLTVISPLYPSESPLPADPPEAAFKVAATHCDESASV